MGLSLVMFQKARHSSAYMRQVLFSAVHVPQQLEVEAVIRVRRQARTG